MSITTGAARARDSEEARPTEVGIEDLAVAIRKAVALPDQIADYLRGMIVSGKWRPGQRIVETRIARELGLGQPTVREALGKLEEAGLVVRTQNSGCRVTQLTAEEYSQIFRVRTSLECLVIEMLIENRSSAQGAELKTALQVLKAAAASRSVEDFYRADLELHRTMWRLSGNKFLEKALSQLVIPLFAFAMIEIVAHPGLDLVLNARKHDDLIRAILSADKAHARQRAEEILKEFWDEGLSLIAEGRKTVSTPGGAPRERRR
jgi:DNA-binding GntR family transcriptional regulator